MFTLHPLAAKADYEIQSSSNALCVKRRVGGRSFFFFCLPSPHALNSALNTYNYIFIYTYTIKNKKENTIGQNYLQLASVCKKLNIMTVAFRGGSSLPRVWRATAADEDSSSDLMDLMFLLGNGCGTLFGCDEERKLNLWMKCFFFKPSMYL